MPEQDDRVGEGILKMLGPVRDMPVLKLDMERVGEILVRIVAMSTMLGHAEPRNSLCYIHPDDGTEGDFVCDVLGRASNAELTKKWFSGAEGATRLAGWMSSVAFGDVIREAAARRVPGRDPYWANYAAEQAAEVIGISADELARLKLAGNGPWTWQARDGNDYYPRQHLMLWLAERARAEMVAEKSAA